MMQFYGSAMYIKCNYTAEEWAIMISGIPFTYDSNPSEIAPIIHPLKMLPFMTVKRPYKLQFFEILTETCFVLEHGYLQSMSQHKSDDIHFKREVHWGLKAIECRFLIRDATVFVCERLPFKFSTTCVTGHFTCILSVYVCDDVNDCLKGEDEYGCLKNNYAAYSLSNMKIHYALYIICARSKNDTLLMYAHVHSLCDGLHRCNFVNEELCSYREVKPIDKSLRYLLNRHHDVPVNDKAVLGFIRDPKRKTLELARRNTSSSSSLLKHALNGSLDVLHQNTNLGTLNALMLPCEEMMTLYTAYDYCIIHNKYPCVYGKYSQICRHVLCTGMFIYVENMVVFAYHLCVTNTLTALQQKTRTTVSTFLVQV